MSASIETVLLDFGGTLDSDGIHWSTLFATAFSKAGFEVERNLLDGAFLYSDKALEKQHDIAQLGLFQHILRQSELMLEHLGLRRTKAEMVAEHFYQIVWQRLKRSALTLEEHRQHQRFGLISNFTPNLPRILKEVRLDEYLACVICSAMVGVSKPSPAIFSMALEGLGATPRRTAMVGDSLTSDIMPAKALGLRTYWIRGDRVFLAGDESAADVTVANVEEALRCINS